MSWIPRVVLASIAGVVILPVLEAQPVPAEVSESLQRARGLRSKGDTGLAIKELENLLPQISSSPGTLPATVRYELGLLYLQVGESAKAADSLQKATTGGLRNLGVSLHLVRALFAAGRINEGFDQACQILEAEPNSADALVSLGHLLFRNLFYEDALKAFRLASKQKPTAYEPVFFAGLTLYLLDRYDEAVQTLEPIAKSTDNPELASLLASAQEKAGRAAEAIAGLRRAIERSPESPHPYVNLALIVLERGEVGEAKALFRKAASLKSRADAKVFYVVTRTSCRDLGGTASSLQDAGSADFLLDVAEVFQSRYHHSSAVELARAARQSKPDSARLLYILGTSCLNLEPWSAEARVFLKRAIELEPDRPEPHFALARAYSRQGSSEMAVQEFRRAVELHPSPSYYTELAHELEKSSQNESALKAYEKALELDKKYAPAHLGLGRLLLRVNRVPESLTYLQQAVDIDSETEEAYYLLGMAYRRAREEEKAELAFRHFERAKKATSRRSALTTGFVSGK